MATTTASGMRGLIESENGQILVSVILGLGLAALFRKACKDNQCIVISGPKAQEVDEVYYKYKDDCYKYTPEQIPC
jgi:hypothetical protein